MPLQVLATLVLIAALGTSHQTDIWVLSATPPALLSVIVVSTLQYALTPRVTSEVASGRRLVVGHVLIPYAISGVGLALAITVSAGFVAQLVYQRTADATLLTSAMRVQALSSALAILATGMTLLSSVFQRYGRAAFAIFLNATLSPTFGAILARPIGVMGAALGAVLGSIVFLAFGTLTSPVQIISEWDVPAEIPRGTVPLALSTTAMQANGISERFLATAYQSGTITALAVSNRMVAAIVGLMTTGLSISLVPQFTRLYLAGGLTEVRDAAIRIQRIVIPLGQAMVSSAVILLLGAGQFFIPAPAGSPRLLAQLCTAYGIYVVAAIAGLATASACYAVGRTTALSSFFVASFGSALVLRAVFVRFGAPVVVVPGLTSLAFLAAWFAGIGLLGQATHSMRRLLVPTGLSAVSFSALALLAWKDNGPVPNLALGLLSISCLLSFAQNLIERLRPPQSSKIQQPIG